MITCSALRARHIDHPDEYPSRYYRIMTQYRIQRDDGVSDAITKRLYASYNEAYQELERYYADLCCSDDREYYRIEEETSAWGTQPTV